MFVDYMVVVSIQKEVISVFATRVMRMRKKRASTLMSVSAIHASVEIALIPKEDSNVNVRKGSALDQMAGKKILLLEIPCVFISTGCLKLQDPNFRRI